MKSKNLKVKKGDNIMITEGPTNKIGLIGKVILIFYNGVMIKLNKEWYTVVKFEHFKIIK